MPDIEDEGFEGQETQEIKPIKKDLLDDQASTINVVTVDEEGQAETQARSPDIIADKYFIKNKIKAGSDEEKIARTVLENPKHRETKD